MSKLGMIKKIIDDQYDRAKKILNENIEALHKTADALLEHETIEGKHIHEILDKGEITSPIVKSTPLNRKNEESEEKVKRKMIVKSQRKIIWVQVLNLWAFPRNS